MTEPRWPSRARIAALLVALGLVVATVVAAVTGSGAAAHCGADTSGQCAELVRTLSARMGLLVGGTAVLMLLLVAGLLRMVSQDEEGRREQTAPAPWE